MTAYQQLISPPPAVLVDARNWASVKDMLFTKMQAATSPGFDIETSNKNAHPGILKLESKKTIFDHRRSIITGFSIYFGNEDTESYYFNLNHADVENRIPWHELRPLLEARDPQACWIIHNGPFEITMFESVYKFKLTNVLCSLQLCVTAYNSDTYPWEKFADADIGGIRRLMPEVMKQFATHPPGVPLTPEQQELIQKVVAKESDAEHSYNGYIDSIAYGYGLKKAVKSWFGFQMTEYKALLDAYGVDRMDELTGEQVAEYGCDDAFWCYQLYVRVMDWLMEENPAAVETYFVQENPMIYVFSLIWLNGWKVNFEAIKKKQVEERASMAQAVRDMKPVLAALLPFPEQPHEKLFKYDTAWYGKQDKKTGEYGYKKYREKIEQFVNSEDEMEDFASCMQVRGAISNAWAAELGVKESQCVNMTHYMPQRTILYDLCGFSYQQADGKTQSDDEARGVMLKRYAKKWATERGLTQDDVIDSEKLKILHPELAEDPRVKVWQFVKRMANLEQRMKLFITNYMLLTDPETERMYPTISSMLDTRRMATSNPNSTQLAKMGESSFVRGFFEGDDENHLVVSADWSSVELDLIAEYSGDPDMVECFSTRPPGDMHSKTAAGMRGLTIPEFKQLPLAKEIRKAAKVINFGYWYSGALGQAAKQFGWSSEQMWEETEKYRETYPVAEDWRCSTINETAATGFIQLRDHLIRYRKESTRRWAEIMRFKFDPYNVPAFTEQIIKKLQRRSGNMAVNALIQGTCATLAKRKALKMVAAIEERGFRARLLGIIHDELVFTCHKDDVIEFLGVLYAIMIDGEGIMQRCLLDSSLTIGKNFEPFDKDKQRFGQVELNELNKGLPCVPPERWEKKATVEEIQQIIDYMTAA